MIHCQCHLFIVSYELMCQIDLFFAVLLLSERDVLFALVEVSFHLICVRGRELNGKHRIVIMTKLQGDCAADVNVIGYECHQRSS